MIDIDKAKDAVIEAARNATHPLKGPFDGYGRLRSALLDLDAAHSEAKVAEAEPFDAEGSFENLWQRFHTRCRKVEEDVEALESKLSDLVSNSTRRLADLEAARPTVGETYIGDRPTSGSLPWGSVPFAPPSPEGEATAEERIWLEHSYMVELSCARGDRRVMDRQDFAKALLEVSVKVARFRAERDAWRDMAARYRRVLDFHEPGVVNECNAAFDALAQAEKE